MESGHRKTIKRKRKIIQKRVEKSTLRNLVCGSFWHERCGKTHNHILDLTVFTLLKTAIVVFNNEPYLNNNSICPLHNSNNVLFYALHLVQDYYLAFLLYHFQFHQ